MNQSKFYVASEISRLQGSLETSLIHLGLILELVKEIKKLPERLADRISALEYDIQETEERIRQLVSLSLDKELMQSNDLLNNTVVRFQEKQKRRMQSVSLSLDKKTDVKQSTA